MKPVTTTTMYEALEENDMRLLRSGDPSVAGPEVLIEEVGGVMVGLGNALTWLSNVGMLRGSLAKAINTLNQYRDAFYDGNREKITTTTYEWWAQKKEA